MAEMPGSTRLDYALLALIAQEPRSGYDLRKIFALTPLAHFSDSPGAVYPALRRLVRKLWVEPVAPRPEGGRRREAFRINAAGRRALRDWLHQPVTRDLVVRDPEGLLLRFAFMGEWLEKREIQAFLEGLLHELRLHLADLESFFARESGRMSATGCLAFESGLAGVRSQISWAQRAARRFRSAERGARKP
jgi:DNA-binding PadR family transcriptional regulator